MFTSSPVQASLRQTEGNIMGESAPELDSTTPASYTTQTSPDPQDRSIHSEDMNSQSAATIHSNRVGSRVPLFTQGSQEDSITDLSTASEEGSVFNKRNGREEIGFGKPGSLEEMIIPARSDRSQTTAGGRPLTSDSPISRVSPEGVVMADSPVNGEAADEEAITAVTSCRVQLSRPAETEWVKTKPEVTLAKLSDAKPVQRENNSTIDGKRSVSTSFPVNAAGEKEHTAPLATTTLLSPSLTKPLRIVTSRNNRPSQSGNTPPGRRLNNANYVLHRLDFCL